VDSITYNTVEGHPTLGKARVTINGKWFMYHGGQVQINGKDCANVAFSKSGQRAECDAPAGVGLNNTVVVTSSYEDYHNGDSDPKSIYNYDPPKITNSITLSTSGTGRATLKVNGYRIIYDNYELCAQDFA
jgi:hypothetical protein